VVVEGSLLKSKVSVVSGLLCTEEFVKDSNFVFQPSGIGSESFKRKRIDALVIEPNKFARVSSSEPGSFVVGGSDVDAPADACSETAVVDGGGSEAKCSSSTGIGHSLLSK
jgi:hypothetical protein